MAYNFYRFYYDLMSQAQVFSSSVIVVTDGEKNWINLVFLTSSFSLCFLFFSFCTPLPYFFEILYTAFLVFTITFKYEYPAKVLIEHANIQNLAKEENTCVMAMGKLLMRD